MVYFRQAKMYPGVNSENVCFRCYTGKCSVLKQATDVLRGVRTYFRHVLLEATKVSEQFRVLI